MSAASAMRPSQPALPASVKLASGALLALPLAQLVAERLITLPRTPL